jgi:hypothetical protein
MYLMYETVHFNDFFALYSSPPAQRRWNVWNTQMEDFLGKNN